MRKSLIDWLVEVYETLTVPYEDRRWRVMCIVQGTVSAQSQSHYDTKSGDWVYKEHTSEVFYILKYNNIGKYDVEIVIKNPVRGQDAKTTDIYIQIVSPWLCGDLDGQAIKEIYKEYPDRLIVPSAGAVTLEPMAQITTGIAANNNRLLTSGSKVSTQKQIALMPGDSLVNEGTGVITVTQKDPDEDLMDQVREAFG